VQEVEENRKYHCPSRRLDSTASKTCKAADFPWKKQKTKQKTKIQIADQGARSRYSTYAVLISKLIRVL
jgi:hypothetical protein